MPEKYVIQDGDCVASIAFERGFFWETVWNYPDNAALNQKRGDPNILKEGDILTIPDKKLKEESCATEQKHTFKVKGVPAKLRLRLMEEPKKEAKPVNETTGGNDGSVEDPDYNPEPVPDEPVKNAPFRLEVDSKVVCEGTTDGDGRIDVALPPNAVQGRLIIRPGTPEERVMPLNFGGMDPMTEISGVRKRLANLGFPCQVTGDEMTDDLAAALRLFQQQNGLEVTGKIDGATKDKLKLVHGS